MNNDIRMAQKAVIALRDPSLAPCFVVKDGAAGSLWHRYIW